MTSNTLTGTARIIRFILRQDRIRLPIWIVVLASMPAGVAASFKELYPTQLSLETVVKTLEANPGITAFYGRIFAPTLGAVTTWRIGTFVALFTGLMCLFLVTRHTRSEEETGRRELVGATVIGRNAPLMAAVITAASASLLVGLLETAAMVKSGLDASGSLALGLAVAATGWVFTGVGAVTAQLTESGRSANGIGVAIIGASFLLRMAGDAAQSDVVAWFTPLGWAQAVRPFAGNRWWVLVVPSVAATLLASIGYSMSRSRDVGAGLMATKSGPADAGPTLSSPLGLAWRLHRGVLYGWLTGYAILGAVIGSLTNAFGQIASDSPEMADIVKRIGGTAAISDAFLAALFGLFGLIASGYSIQVVLRLRSEEVDQRADPILATAVSRLRWVAGHVVFAAAGPVAILLVAGLTTGIAYGTSVGDVPGTLGSVLGGLLVHLPAVWLVGGFALALDGLAPRTTVAMWAVLGMLVIITLFGPAFQFPQGLLDVSPFTHVPKLPGGSYSATPETVLLVIAAALTGAGFAGMRRRDLG